MMSVRHARKTYSASIVGRMIGHESNFAIVIFKVIRHAIIEAELAIER
jgi:hypothetical protein